MEFLPYPHLIATLFNGCAFGPPLPFTATSTWTWVDHPVSGLRSLTYRPVQTWYPFGSTPSVLNLASIRNSPDRSTKSTRFIFIRCSTACKHRVSGSLSLPSRGPFHLSFTVLFSIGHWVVFSLRGWSPCLPSRFHVPRCTLDPAAPYSVSLTRLSRSLVGLSSALQLPYTVTYAVLTPACTHAGLGSSAFARRYLRNRCFFLFLRLLRCFSSAGSLRMTMDSSYGD